MFTRKTIKAITAAVVVLALVVSGDAARRPKLAPTREVEAVIEVSR